MPYKDKEKRKEAVRESMRKSRVNPDNVNPSGEKDVNPKILLKRPNGHDYNPDERLPGGELRYIGPFSDGQVLDKLTVPEPNVPNVRRFVQGKVFIPNREQLIENGLLKK